MLRSHCILGVVLTALLATAPLVALAQIPAATTVQLPTFGVAIDADGVLSVKSFPDPEGKLRAAQRAAAKANLPGNMLAPSKLRKVSLVKLERALAERVKQGKPVDDALLHLAGLQRVQYVFCYPKERELIIAGPAEGWLNDPSGRAVGLTTGKPVLELADLAVALRAFPPGSRERPFLGCTIDPNPANLAKLVEFQKKVPHAVSQSQRGAVAEFVAKGQRDALGLADIRVFGVPANSHFARVLLEADYRMKLIGLGLEPQPVRMSTFLTAITGPSKNNLQRWWFTPNYECVKVTADRTGMELVGQGVMLQCEEKVIGPNGKLMDTGGEPSRASTAFTESFTSKYAEISDRLPVYAQMRNLFDLSIAAAYIRQQDFYGKTEWQAAVLRDEKSFSVATLPVPKQVQCVVNAVWKGSRLVSPAGGGVSLMPDEALDPKRLVSDSDGKLAEQHRALATGLAGEAWWWD